MGWNLPSHMHVIVLLFLPLSRSGAQAILYLDCLSRPGSGDVPDAARCPYNILTYPNSVDRAQSTAEERCAWLRSMSRDTYTDAIVGITRNICHIYLLNVSIQCLLYTSNPHSLTPEEGSQIQ